VIEIPDKEMTDVLLEIKEDIGGIKEHCNNANNEFKDIKTRFQNAAEEVKHIKKKVSKIESNVDTLMTWKKELNGQKQKVNWWAMGLFSAFIVVVVDCTLRFILRF
jgi:chromosome segregation ATPase